MKPLLNSLFAGAFALAATALPAASAAPDGPLVTT